MGSRTLRVHRAGGIRVDGITRVTWDRFRVTGWIVRPRAGEGGCMTRVRHVRMADIAARVGVSRTAVSFVLNDRTEASISEATKARIIQVANELGYRPHAARALSRPNVRA